MEIVGSTMPDGSTYGHVMEGVFVHPSDFNPKRSTGSHDEL